jgi:hypothetical protein
MRNRFSKPPSLNFSNLLKNVMGQVDFKPLSATNPSNFASGGIASIGEYHKQSRVPTERLAQREPLAHACGLAESFTFLIQNCEIFGISIKAITLLTCNLLKDPKLPHVLHGPTDRENRMRLRVPELDGRNTWPSPTQQRPNRLPAKIDDGMSSKPRICGFFSHY